MKRGHGKQKGSAFERQLCHQLSLWVSGGQQKDLFWRSAMSGGRATVARGEVRQAGDICAVAPEGHSLTNRFYIEAKFYADLAFDRFFLDGTGILLRFWEKTDQQASKYRRHPVLIAKQNLYPAVVLVWSKSVLRDLTLDDVPHIECVSRDLPIAVRLDDLLQTKYQKRVRV